jgi:hypothetical protein
MIQPAASCVGSSTTATTLGTVFAWPQSELLQLPGN